jgi:hypothetical protein
VTSGEFQPAGGAFADELRSELPYIVSASSKKYYCDEYWMDDERIYFVKVIPQRIGHTSIEFNLISYLFTLT